jgi:hypothetical protein
MVFKVSDTQREQLRAYAEVSETYCVFQKASSVLGAFPRGAGAMFVAEGGGGQPAIIVRFLSFPESGGKFACVRPLLELSNQAEVAQDPWVEPLFRIAKAFHAVETEELRPLATLRFGVDLSHICGWPGSACFEEETATTRSRPTRTIRVQCRPRAAPFYFMNLVFDRNQNMPHVQPPKPSKNIAGFAPNPTLRSWCEVANEGDARARCGGAEVMHAADDDSSS